MALAPQNRISLREYREKFFESGRSLHFPLLQVIILKESALVPQFAISVSKKVAKKAHDRNLLRRQIQQLIQENLISFPPYKYLFLPKKSTSLSYSDLLISFNSLLSQLRQSSKGA